jgi:peroxiredoxin
MTITKSIWLAVSLASALASLAVAEEPAQLGKPAPAFSLQDTDGKAVSLAQFKGKTVVLEWFNPDCPFAKKAHAEGPLKDLAKRVANPKLVWLTINSSAPGKQGHGKERNVAAKQEYGMTNALLLDEDGKVGHAYGAEKTPHIFVIDAKGVLRYRGGLDNAPMGVVDDNRPRLPGTDAGSLEPYVEDALQDLQQKRAVRLPETAAWGCSVKYAD